jgi:hypothetical protein
MIYSLVLSSIENSFMLMSLISNQMKEKTDEKIFCSGLSILLMVSLVAGCSNSKVTGLHFGRLHINGRACQSIREAFTENNSGCTVMYRQEIRAGYTQCTGEA